MNLGKLQEVLGASSSLNRSPDKIKIVMSSSAFIVYRVSTNHIDYTNIFLKLSKQMEMSLMVYQTSIDFAILLFLFTKIVRCVKRLT